MKQFVLGLMSGVLLMLLRDIPRLAWERPIAIKHALMKSIENLATLAVVSFFVGLTFLVAGKNPLHWEPLPWVLLAAGIGLFVIPLGIAALTRFIQDVRRAEAQETASENARAKSKPERYEPRRTNSRHRS